MILNMGAPVATSIGKAPMVASAVGRVAGARLTAAQLDAIHSNQGICNQAASARDRQSPAYPALAKQCAASRAANVANGIYYVDGMTPDDPSYRVALTNAGEVAIAKNPTLQQMRANLPDPDGEGRYGRGWTMAQGVRAGSVDPAFPAWVAAGLALSPALLQGFNDGLNPPQELTQAQQPPEDAVDSIPRPVLIGGGVVLALGLGLLAYKLTR